MRRIEIQLPDEVFAHAQKVCEERQLSLARRGIENLLSVNSLPEENQAQWQPPKP